MTSLLSSRRLLSQSRAVAQPIIAVRRENKNRWERRAPLIPEHVKELKDMGIRVLVQPSNLRIFNDNQYLEAGAEIVEDISPASVILGVKEVPKSDLLPHKTYVCFSHTIKGQEANMDMLDDVLAKGIRLIDYECMVDENTGRRLVGFGRYAGIAGMMDLYRGLGERMLALGYTNPFLGLGYTDMYPSLDSLRRAIRDVGSNIKTKGFPKELSPVIFAFTGTGNVTKGSLEIFEELPHEYITPDELEEVVREGNRHKVYGVKLDRGDLVQLRDPSQRGGFDKAHYDAHPELYAPIFHHKIAPNITALVNGMYWDARFPRLLSVEQMRQLQMDPTNRLLAIADISADPDGSIEFTRTCTTIDHRFEVYNPKKDIASFDWESDGVLLGSVDNLPAELPTEASLHFSNSLLPFIPQLAAADPAKPFAEQAEDLGATLHNAVLTCHGELTPKFEYIADIRAANEAEKALEERSRSVLLLGSGLIAPQYIENLKKTLGNMNVSITVAGAIGNELRDMKRMFPEIETVELDINRQVDDLKYLVKASDVVVSLLPASLHLVPAKLCIDYGVDMVTTSYVSDEMAELDAAAKEAGVVIMNECGLDPGIDHFMAVDMFQTLKDDPTVFRIKDFVSWCGGLPAVHCADNPLGYKFSWSPRGVLAAAKNAARYRENSEEVEIRSGELPSAVRPLNIGRLALEGVPNRDSIKYEKVYGVDGLDTCLRGTLRFPGFWERLRDFTDAGMMNDTGLVDATSLKGYLQPLSDSALRNRVLDTLAGCGVSGNSRVDSNATPIDMLSNLLARSLIFRRGEQDMIVLRHSFTAESAYGEVEANADLILLGEKFPTHKTAMSHTVSAPCALATRYVLQRNDKEDATLISPGVARPTNVNLCRKFLTDLDNEFDIRFKVTSNLDEMKKGSHQQSASQ